MVAKIRTHAPETLLVFLILSAFVAIIVLIDTSPTLADSIGYIVAGQRLAGGFGPTYSDLHNSDVGPYFYLHAFRIIGNRGPDAIFGYPPGYPVLIAAATRLFQSKEIAHYVVPILSLVSLPIVYFLGTILTGRKWVGFWSTVLLATAPIYWEFSTSAWSEIPSLVFISSGISVYVLAYREADEERPRALLMALSATLIGFSFFIRYTNVFLVVPTLILHSFYVERMQYFRPRPHWIFFLITALSICGVLVYNWAYFGGPFKSIYSTPELGAYPWPYFSIHYALGPSPVNGYSLREVARTLWGNFPIIVLLAPVGWRAMTRPNALVSGGVVLSAIALYSVYAFAPEGLNARFLLPATPFLCVAMASGGVTLGRHLPGQRLSWALAAAALFLLLVSLLPDIRQLYARHEQNNSAVAYVQQITSQTPDNSVWISTATNDLIAFYGTRSVLNYRRMFVTDPDSGQFDYKGAQACLVQAVDRLLDADIPVYVIFDSTWGLSETVEANYEITEEPFGKNIYEIRRALVDDRRASLPECVDDTTINRD
jgi:hypothetical protein